MMEECVIYFRTKLNTIGLLAILSNSQIGEEQVFNYQDRLKDNFTDQLLSIKIKIVMVIFQNGKNQVLKFTNMNLLLLQEKNFLLNSRHLVKGITKDKI
jgi:hypothetical protein